MWKMFIDDERVPSGSELNNFRQKIAAVATDIELDEQFVVVRSVAEAQEKIQTLGAPVFISFDHDLGDKVPSGFDLAKWLVDQDLDNNGQFLPDDFDFFVHSANPPGRKNIEGLMMPYLEYRNRSQLSLVKKKI